MGEERELGGGHDARRLEEPRHRSPLVDVVLGGTADDGRHQPQAFPPAIRGVLDGLVRDEDQARQDREEECRDRSDLQRETG